jgi:hypothetical protein
MFFCSSEVYLIAEMNDSAAVFHGVISGGSIIKLKTSEKQPPGMVYSSLARP